MSASRQVRYANSPEKTLIYKFDDCVRIIGHTIGDSEDLMTITIVAEKSKLQQIVDVGTKDGEKLFLMFTLGVEIEDSAT